MWSQNTVFSHSCTYKHPQKPHALIYTNEHEDLLNWLAHCSIWKAKCSLLTCLWLHTSHALYLTHRDMMRASHGLTDRLTGARLSGEKWWEEPVCMCVVGSFQSNGNKVGNTVWINSHIQINVSHCKFRIIAATGSFDPVITGTPLL